MRDLRRFPFGNEPAPARLEMPARQTEPLVDFVPPERVLPFRAPRPVDRTMRLPASRLPDDRPAPDGRRSEWLAVAVIALALVVLDALALSLMLGRP